MVEVQTESMQSLDVGLVVVVVEEVELVGGSAEETREDEGVMVSLVSGGGDVVVTAATKVTEPTEVTEVESSLATITELVVAAISDVLVEGTEAVVVTVKAASPPAARGASTERSFGSGKVDLVDKFVDVVETGLLGAQTVSKLVVECVVVVVELEVTEMLGVMDSEEVTEAVVGGSVGVVVLVRVV